MTRLILANFQYLQQAAKLVDMLEDSSYVRAEPMFYNSTIGGHIRHCLEHYEALTQGVSEGKIDYDNRCRDVEVENKTEAASERINNIITALKSLTEENIHQNIKVKMDCGGHENCDEAPVLEQTEWQSSTIGRELQFLVSHTVHHFAMIRGISQRGGVELDQDFGMAPSTLRHEKGHQEANRGKLKAQPVSK